jgi:group I intron endonuclease
MKTIGIYQIQSKIKPERVYIGSSIRIESRWNVHLRELRLNIHHSSKLQRHFNKYGESDLSFSILCRCNKEDLIVIEQKFLDSNNPFFNECCNAGNKLGFKHSEETISKMKKPHHRFSKKKKRLSKETRKKLSDSHLGKKNPMYKKVVSVETRNKLKVSTTLVWSLRKSKNK